MQVAKPKKGYKLVKTSFGKYEEIPEEWEETKFSDISKIKRGASPRPIADPKYFGNGRGWIRISDVTKSQKYLKTTKDHLSNLGESKSVPVNPNDLIMSIAASLAIPIILKTEACIHDGFITFSSLSKSIDVEFLYFMLLQSRSKFLNQGQMGTQNNLNAEIVGETTFAKPPLSEQKQISSILSNVDDTLQKTNQIIEQTQRLKTGMMQKLLTRGIGHTKFKKVKWLFEKYIEIPEEWEHKELDTISKIVGGGTPDTTKNEYWDGDIPWAVPTDITNLDRNYIEKTRRNITKEGLDKSSSKLLPKNSILLTTRATIGYCAICTKSMATNQGFQNVICNSNADNLFILYALRFNKNLLTSLANGTTFTEISKRNISSVKIAIPPLPEQQKIASILSNVDIQIQKEKLHKSNLERLKKGLMQKLLTGQIRVRMR